MNCARQPGSNLNFVSSASPIFSGDKARRPAAKKSFQIYFLEQWAEWLELQFVSDAEIAMTFDVTTVTVRNWKNQVAAPRGPQVAFAMLSFPALAERLRRCG